MARRKAFVHIGLPHSGGAILDPALEHHEASLSRLGVHRPAKSADEMFRAAVEILRDHRAWGYRRRDVEGSWSAVCRRARKGKGAVVVGQHLLAAAAPVEIDLFLEGLAGFEVHIVVIAAAPANQATAPNEAGDLSGVLDRWAAALRRPDRVHVIVAPDIDRRAQAIWAAYGRIVGFDASALHLPDLSTTEAARTLALRHSPLWEFDRALTSLDPHESRVELADRWAKDIADGGYDLHGDTADLIPVRGAARSWTASGTEDRLRAAEGLLGDALVESARLRAHNEVLEQRLATLQRSRKKLKRRLADLISG
ncbi:hypothetical protein [Nocardioides sp.]|uniref:hypothetical protein n=1 Tax=Nocardioides sp. TaxID=35761 RepID=UPI0031FE9E79|nr:hypothetical protein [Nocardioides sp.]